MADKSSESGYYEESTMKRSRNIHNRDSNIDSDDGSENYNELESSYNENEVVTIDDDTDEEDDPCNNNNGEASPDRHREYENDLRDSEETERNDSESDVVIVNDALPTAAELSIELSKIRSKGEPLHPDDRVSIKNFKLLKLLGTGAYGEVFLVEKRDGLDQGELYAMKILKKKKVTLKNKTIEHTRTEREVLEKVIDCPFLATLHYAFQTPEKLYLVMDFVQGGELFTHLFKDEHFAEAATRFYIAEIIIALEQLHQLNVIYRDIKLENILLDAQGHIVITDFGLSKEIIDNTKAYSYCGTIEYMAPEIVSQGEEGHDLNVDWWSVGVLTIELLTGQSPFSREGEESNQSVISERIKKDPPTIPATIGVDARDLIEKLLKKNVSERLGFKNDAQELKNHRFFKKIDWDKLKKKVCKPPKTPELESKDDVGQFADEFTAKEPVESAGELLPIKDAEKLFQGYSFVATHLRRHRASPSDRADTVTRPSFEQVLELQRKGGSEFFDQYSINENDEPIGDGTYSICMRCTSLENGKKYAVKIMSLNHDATQEVDALKVCQGHQNIVKFYGHIEDSHHSYLVFELLDGGELFSRIRDREHFNEEIARNIFCQLVEAIGHMHGQNIVHRDLKPENIMFVNRDEKSLLKLVDFGFARRRASEETTPCYTLEYAAPESLKNGTTKESRDMWSLGVILYTMLVGVTPFLPKDITKRDEKPYRLRITNNIFMGNFDKTNEAWKNISPAAKDLIKRLLEVNEDARFQFEDVINHSWVTQENISESPIKTRREHEQVNGFHKTSVKYLPETITIDDDSTELPPIKEQREEVCSNDSSGIVLSDGNEGSSRSSHIDELAENKNVQEQPPSEELPIVVTTKSKPKKIPAMNKTKPKKRKTRATGRTSNVKAEQPIPCEVPVVENMPQNERINDFKGFSKVPVMDIGDWIFVLSSISRARKVKEPVYQLEDLITLDCSVDVPAEALSLRRNVITATRRAIRSVKKPKIALEISKIVPEALIVVKTESNNVRSKKNIEPEIVASKLKRSVKVKIEPRDQKQTETETAQTKNLKMDHSKVAKSTRKKNKKETVAKEQVDVFETPIAVAKKTRKFKEEPVDQTLISINENSAAKEQRRRKPTMFFQNEPVAKRLRMTKVTEQPADKKTRGRPKNQIKLEPSQVTETKQESKHELAPVSEISQCNLPKRDKASKKIVVKEEQANEPLQKRFKLEHSSSKIEYRSMILEKRTYAPQDAPILSIDMLRTSLLS